MAHDKLQSWLYAEDFVAEDQTLLRARDRATELGCTPVSPGTGAVLSLLASTADARAVVEIGTGTGVASLWLLRGMRDDGVLTTIDHEAEHHLAAKDAFTEAEIRPTRVRVITGRAQSVVPRLTDAGYDMVVIDADVDSYDDYLEQAIRLLRVGGLLVIPNALNNDLVPDPARRDPATVAARQVVKKLSDDERVTTTLLSAGSGVLAATKL